MVIGQGGLGTLRSIDLNKRLAGASVSVSADIGETEEGLSGGASLKDLETMFQLIYLTFTAPRADPVAFRVMTGQLKVALANRSALPDTAFDEALDAALSQNHFRAQPMTAARVDQMNLDKSLAFYKDRFADASDFIFVFVGSFDLADHEAPRRALPGQPAGPSQARDGEGCRHASADRRGRKAGRKGIEPKSQVSIVFTGPFQNDEMHRVVLRAMAETLSGNLHRTLREDLGGTYGVSVEPSFTKRPTEEYRLTISFGCDPARTRDLVKAAVPA